MTQASTGDKVRVHYTGKLNDGSIFDSSQGREPLEFEIGAKQIIPGFEKAVIGMEPGETNSVEVPPEDAYGPYQEHLQMEVSIAQMPDNVDLTVGNRLQVRQGEQAFPVSIVEVTDDTVKLDGNHPLAGQELSFEINLVEIV